MSISNPNSKVYLKAAQIARARVLGASKNLTDAEIASQFGLSFGGFTRLIHTPEYQEMEAQVLAMVTKKQDAQLDGNLGALTKQFQKQVPVVMQRILDIAMQSRDLKMALEASKEWLDRDPGRTLTKDGHRGSGPGSASTAPLPQEVLRQLESDSSDIVNEVMGQPISDAVQ